MSKIALITGITGQDGSYLAELLLEKDYIVHGIIRRSSSFNTKRIEHLYRDKHNKDVKFFLHYGDMTDSNNLHNIINNVKPHEIYNLAAQSHVKVSFELSEYTGDVDGIGTLRILNAIKDCDLIDTCRFYQASTSELYGKVQEIPQTEETPFYPRSPYGVAKLYSYWIVKNYRESYNIHASNGILFNHESPRRGETFITRKITIGLSNILHDKEECLYLGNINSKRDWGYAKDYVYGMWLMLQQDNPDDYVLSTNETHSVREFIELSFKYVGYIIEWSGDHLDEVGIARKIETTGNDIDNDSNINKNYKNIDGQVVIRIDSEYFRPSEVDILIGDSSKAKNKLNWISNTSFNKLVELMIESDL